MTHQKLPSREEVAPTLTEAEAFESAEKTYNQWITANAHPESKEIVRELEAVVLKPAFELHLGGLNVLSGQDFSETPRLSVALACFAADHLLWGWFSSVIAHPRVSLTLSRGAAEASIFQVFSVHSPADFQKVWNSRQGTGGSVLRRLDSIPSELFQRLRTAWLITAPLGHASVLPVTSAFTSFQDGGQIGRGLAFAGRFGGPLDEEVLRNLCNLYTMVAVTCVEALAFSLKEELRDFRQWHEKYQVLRETLNRQVPIPSHIEENLAELRARLKVDR